MSQILHDVQQFQRLFSVISELVNLNPPNAFWGLLGPQKDVTASSNIFGNAAVKE